MVTESEIMEAEQKVKDAVRDLIAAYKDWEDAQEGPAEATRTVVEDALSDEGY